MNFKTHYLEKFSQFHMEDPAGMLVKNAESWAPSLGPGVGGFRLQMDKLDMSELGAPHSGGLSCD